MRGLIIGRFVPLHRGHQYLIDTALTIVSHLTICVRDTQDATIPLTTRMAWLKEMYPEAQVIGMPDLEDDLDTQAWVTHTQSFLGFTPDIFFSSETYGDDFAKILGIRHFMVDQARLAFPVYAAEVRKDPFRYWNYLEPCVRSYFALRIRVLGAESTGKTTLCQDLARCYKTSWVPEYGREYTERVKKGFSEGMWTSQEFIHIAREQNRLEDQMARQANRLLICDTDSLATAVWHERYMKFWSPVVANFGSTQHYDLTLVTGDEIPFVQDGFRDGERIRHWMTERFIHLLEERHEPFVLVAGSPEERLASAIQEIQSVVKKKAYSLSS